jgi:hypothetical protein
MSWFSKNYEKAILGGSAAVALGLAYLGWSTFGGVDEAFPSTFKGPGANHKTAVPDADSIPKALQSLKIDRTWTQAMDGTRPVNLFTGIPLFMKSSEPEKPIDLLTDLPVHPPIPNTWWLENRLEMVFADSPNRDPDADGFNNREEFDAKTDPNNSKSIPELIAKLMYVKADSMVWVVRPGFETEGRFAFSYEDSKLQTNKLAAGEMIGPNELFFVKEPMAQRFKLLGSEVRKEMNKATKIETDVTIVRIEDQRPNKKGTIYEIPSPLTEAKKAQHVKIDWTGVFSLEALELNGKEFKVEENTTFALPPNAPKKDYLLKKINQESVTIEYTDSKGTLKTVAIKKGGLPRPTE